MDWLTLRRAAARRDGCGAPAVRAIMPKKMRTPALLESHWSGLDHVLLDLDGTLLDLDFDNHFWQTLVPQAWGAARGLDLEAARMILQPRFAACAGTLLWYSTEHWSQELGLDIAALKRADADRIRWLPGAQRFLAAARARGKRLVLLTNAHPHALALKHERTRVLDHFDASFSAHELGAPKEDPRFWLELQRLERLDPPRSLFVDDSAAVLRAARAAGIGLIRAIRRPDTVRAGHRHEEFTAVDALVELLR
jgi:5'-nucleotidase